MTAYPPGPPLPRVGTTLLWMKRPFWILDECARRYGEPFTIDLLGLRRLVVVYSPETVKQVFADDGDTFAAGKFNRSLAGLLGVLLLYLWLGTAHRAAWANQNLLLLDPLCLVLLPGAWRLLRNRSPGRWFGRVLLAVFAGGALAWVMRWLPFFFAVQDNARWIALLLPVHAALALRLRRA